MLTTTPSPSSSLPSGLHNSVELCTTMMNGCVCSLTRSSMLLSTVQHHPCLPIATTVGLLHMFPFLFSMFLWLSLGPVVVSSGGGCNGYSRYGMSYLICLSLFARGLVWRASAPTSPQPFTSSPPLYALCRQYLLNRDWVQRIRGTTSKAPYTFLRSRKSFYLWGLSTLGNKLLNSRNSMLYNNL